MTLLVGLGNIGKEYELTRHNVGFMLIDLILSSNDFEYVGGKKFSGELYKKSNVLLLKPSTYMNSSGVSVKSVCDFYKPEHIIVIHDDLDLELGSLKFKNGGSNAGHNGLKSIDLLIGSDYNRVRIGIGNNKNNTIAHVLGKFTTEQFEILNRVLEKAKEAVFELIKTKDINSISSKFTSKAVAS